MADTPIAPLAAAPECAMGGMLRFRVAEALHRQRMKAKAGRIQYQEHDFSFSSVLA